MCDLLTNIFKKKFSCIKCKSEYGTKFQIKQHFNRKNSCNGNEDMSKYIIETLFTSCPKCSMQIKTITSINFMQKHLDICKYEQPNTIINNNNTNNNTNNIQININLRSFTDPVLNHLNYEEKLILDRPRILEKLHFNPNVPENHSLKYDSLKNNFRIYIKNDKYVEVPFDQIISKIAVSLDNAQTYMLDKEFLDSSEHDKASTRINRTYSEYEKNNESKYIQIIKDGSTIVERTHKLIELQNID